MNWLLLKTSLIVSSLTTALAMTFGVAAALWISGLAARWRNRFLAVAVIALSLPPFMVCNAWLHFFGLTGVWRSWLPFDIYSLPGTVLILSLLLWPIPMLLLLGAWQRLESHQLEADPALRGWPFFRWLLWPMGRTVLGLASVLTFVLALNNFAVPAILQVKVFPVELWINFNATFNYAEALKTSWPLVIAPSLFLLCFARERVCWPKLDEQLLGSVFRRQLGQGWFWFTGGLALLIVLLSVGLPLTQLVSARRTWTEFSPALAAGAAACWHSFLFAVVTATIVVACGIVTWRWKMGFILWLPFFVPGVLLGIALIFALNRPAAEVFYRSIGVVFLAFTLRYLALGWNAAAFALRGVDHDLTDAARLSGASRWQLWRHVHWPQTAPQLAAAWYVTYLLCLWDVETLVLLWPPGGETLALRVFNLLHYGHNAQVNAICLLLLMLAILPLLLWASWRWLKSKIALVSLAGLGFLVSGCAEKSSHETPIHSRFFSTVQILGSRGAGAGEFNKPRSLALDTNDNLYVADMTGRVQKFSPDGVFLLSWQMPQTDKGKPKGMCRDSASNIVVVEPHYSRVNHFSPDGKLVEQWGQYGTNTGHLAFPRAVAINSQGVAFVSEYGLVERVQGFAPRGRALKASFGTGGTGPGEFNRAEGLGMDSADRIYIADSCNHRIQVFSPDGKWLRAYGKAGSSIGELSYPYDVRVDANGVQFVCEFGNSRIQIFDANDQSVEILGGVGGEPGRFNNPWSIALDSHGNLYVADSGNHRVQKFLRKQSLVSRELSVVRVPATDNGQRTTDLHSE